MDGATPVRLGKYRLVRRLAVGGMAEIHLAVAEGMSGFEKRVVVKRLLPQHIREQDLLTMFVDEARLLARMRHPNLTEVYDIGQDGDEIFFALEHVQGVDLREIVRDLAGAPLPIEEILWVLLGVAEGLHHAHELRDDQGKTLGIVHRDVSSSNVLLADDGAVKLIDFGVAKWHAQRSETRHGTLKGKANYMSPEQCRSEALDARSDVFALGVLLYELSTGRRPFAADNDFDVLGAIVAGRYVAPAAARPGYDEELAVIVRRALALSRDERIASARGFADELRGYARRKGIAATGDGIALRVRRLLVDRAGARGGERARAVGQEIARAAGDVAGARGALADGDPATLPGQAALERTLTAAGAVGARGAGSEGAPAERAKDLEPTRDGRTRSASFARRARRRFGMGMAIGAAIVVLAATAFVAATANRRSGESGPVAAPANPGRSDTLALPMAVPPPEAPARAGGESAGAIPPPPPPANTLRAAVRPLTRDAATSGKAIPVRAEIPDAGSLLPRVWDPDSPIPP